MTGWAASYVGLPYRAGGRERDGLDCWGLLRLVYAEQLGIDLPAYGAAPDPAERAELAALIRADREAGPWHRVAEIAPFDGLLFRVGGHEMHMAVAIDDSWMLHVSHGGQAVIQRIADPMWRSRFVGAYRHTGSSTATAPATAPVASATADSVHVTEVRGMLDQRRNFDVVPLLTLEEIVHQALPGATEAALDRVRLSVRRGDAWQVVPRAWWPRIRPHAGTELTIRLVPGASYVGMQIALFLSANTALGTFAINALAIGGALAVTALGAAALTSLIPTPDTPEGPRDAEKGYSLQGWTNEAIPGETVQDVAGEMRVAPVYVVTPYQEIVGDKQYLRALFSFGYGPLELSDLRFGETSIEEFDEVQIELRQGLPGDDPVTITGMQVIEDVEQIETVYELPQDEAGNTYGSTRVETPIVRTTASNTVRVNIVFYLPALFHVESDGDLNPNSVLFRIEHRRRGASGWEIVEPAFRIAALRNGPFFRSYGWGLPERGTWEVRITRISSSDAGSRNSVTCYFAALQSFRPEYPINLEAMTAPLALCSIRVRATNNISGTIDGFNALAKRRGRIWNGSRWTDGTSRNPATAYLWALQGWSNPNPVPDDQIDWSAIRDWYLFCEETGLTYDREHRAFEGLIDRLKAIARAGRASPWHDGVRWSVIIDRVPEAIVDQITPRNSRAFSGTRTYPKPPHAVRVRFRDRTNDYADAEVTIRWPGHSGPITLIEQWDIAGKTDPVEIQREIYRQMLTVEHRRDRWTVEQDGALRHATRGDWVWLSHYNLARFQSAGRVVSTEGDLVVLDETVEMQAGQAYGIRYVQFDADDTIGDTVLCEVQAVPGRSRTLRILSGSRPAPGDLVSFGPLTEVGERALVLDVEPGEEFGYTLTLTNAAPEIDALTADFVPEPWDSVVGQIIATGTGPLPPAFRGVLTEAAADGYGDTGRTLAVTVGAASADTSLIAGLELEHRLQGQTDWNREISATAAATFRLSYELLDVVEMRARASDFGGTDGPWTSVATFTVGVDAAALPAKPDIAAITATGDLGHARLTLSHGDAATKAIRIFRTPQGAALDVETDGLPGPIAVSAGASAQFVDGDATRSTLLADGSFDDPAAWTAAGGWAIGSGTAVHTPGSASLLSQPLATEAGRTYRGQVTITGRTAGSILLRLTGSTPDETTPITATGQVLFSLPATSAQTGIEIEASADFDGTLESVTLILETAACAPAGTALYRFAALNADDVASALSDPITITII